MSTEIALVALTVAEARIADALFERLFPAGGRGPGASEIGVVSYVDRALSGHDAEHLPTYRAILAGLDSAACQAYGEAFPVLAPAQQDELIEALASGRLAGPFGIARQQQEQQAVFALLRAHLQEGLFADPAYGGNRDAAGWRLLGHPGVWLENSAEENLTEEPATKGGAVRTLADALPTLARDEREEAFKRAAHASALSPLLADEVDVVLVGVGAMGGLAAPVFTEAGLTAVGLEAGPWRGKADFTPDELGQSYYARAGLGPKFAREVPRWRRRDADETVPATFSLGRMVNGVGGSAGHWGAWLRRFHPWHFRPLTRVREQWGEQILPDGASVVDWPVDYDELEPYYTRLEHLIGVAGDESNPFVRRSRALPMPPLRPFSMGERFSAATRGMGLHPHPVPVGMNSIPYGGRPATTYTAWSNGFGSFHGDRWHPGISDIPRAVASGRFELRTRARVLRVVTDERGAARGVEYLDPEGRLRVQRARAVVLAAYTFENVRLLFLSADRHHRDGLGNNSGQLGRHLTCKMFAHVNGFFPDACFNRHTGPAAQGVVIDDFLAEDFDSVAHGFVGGATLGAEQQFLPLQISREALPADIRPWGEPYRDHLLEWQRFGVVRIQPDALPYSDHRIDLDPRYRERSALGLPVVRVTYDLRDNELRLAAWAGGMAAEVLRRMGASKTWEGPAFTGVGSSHELGGCRMGSDPAASVLDPWLAVHDTPNLYVFGGAALPSSPGINPSLTIGAVVLRAAERLAAELRGGGSR